MNTEETAKALMDHYEPGIKEARRFSVRAEVVNARGSTFVRLHGPHGTLAILSVSEAEAVAEALARYRADR